MNSEIYENTKLLTGTLFKYIKLTNDSKLLLKV